MDWTKIELGTYLKLTSKGLEQGLQGARPTPLGDFEGVTRGGLLRVRPHGNSTAETYHPNFWGIAE